MKSPNIVYLLLLCGGAAYAQEQASPQPPKRATVTFVGQGGKPIRVIEDGGKTETVDQKDMRPLNVPPGTTPARAAEPEADASEAAAEESATTPAETPPAEPAKEEEQPPDETLLKQLIEGELRAASEPTLKGAKREAAKTRELTPKEKAILEQVRADMQKANTPQLRGAANKDTPTAQLSPEEQALREKLVKELNSNATPQLPASAQERNRRRANSRTTKGENPSGISAPLPAHLLTQPPPQLPDKDKKKPRP